jgi:GTP-binding protein Era
MTLNPHTPYRSGFVAVVGRPNVGKSSLMNAYLGEKIAIVSPKPQTTRHTQLGILSEKDYQLIFVDTPGMHEPRNKLGEYMVEAAARAMLDADAILFIVDASAPPHADDVRLAQTIQNRAGAAPVVLALNKSDVLKPAHVLPHTEAYRALVPEAKWMLISATRGDNLAELRQMLIDVLPEGPALFPEDELTQTHLRDLCAELIREAALTSLEQEVPHGIAIEIELFDETSKPGLVRVSSVLYVEREAHKGIVIGAGGSKLKEIGVNARQQMETLLQQKVFLEVHVKVRRNWREKENEVHRMGYRKQE